MALYNPYKSHTTEVLHWRQGDKFACGRKWVNGGKQATSRFSVSCQRCVAKLDEARKLDYNAFDNWATPKARD